MDSFGTKGIYTCIKFGLILKTVAFFSKGVSKKEKDKDYNSTKNYKPSGIYNNDILERIQNKFTT